MEQLFQKFIERFLGDSWFGVAVVLLLLGIPYCVRAWKEVFSHKQELEKAKLQIDILRSCMELTNSEDAETIARIRGIAKRVAFDEKLVGSPEEKVQGLTPVLLSNGAVILLFCAIVWGSYHLTSWLYHPPQRGFFVPLAYIVFLIWWVGRFLKAMFASDEEPQLGVLACMGGALLGAIWSFIQVLQDAAQ